MAKDFDDIYFDLANADTLVWDRHCLVSVVEKKAVYYYTAILIGRPKQRIKDECNINLEDIVQF